MQQLKYSEHFIGNLALKQPISKCLTSIICIYHSRKKYSKVAEIPISQLASFIYSILATLLSQLSSNYSIRHFVVNHKIASNKGIFS